MNYKHIILLLILCSVVGTASAAVASFTASPTSGLAPLSVSFDDQSNGGTSWKWDFGDGMVVIVNGGTSGSTSYTYTNPGTYNAVLTVNGAATKSRTITVMSPTTIPTERPTPISTPKPTTIPTTIPTIVPITIVPTTTQIIEPQFTNMPPTTSSIEPTPTWVEMFIPTTEPTVVYVPTRVPTVEPIVTPIDIITTIFQTPKPAEPQNILTPIPTIAPYHDNVVDIVSPWLPFINRGQTMVKFQIGDVVYIIRRG